jgi:hypothetical protein
MFSFVYPMDTNRLEQFAVTKRAYDEMPQTKEFIIPTRSEFQVARYLDDNKLMKDVRLIPYEWTEGFNPSMGFNLGVKNAKYDQIIITSPEVKPHANVLDSLEEVIGKNIVCQVFDQDEHGNLVSLVQQGYRSENPAYYFLAMFNKSDIEKINGWDEDFMLGYAYEDNDFGARWVRAGLPFEVRDDIQATHLYHPRGETIPGGLDINRRKFDSNNEKGVVYCQNGLKNGTI